MKTNFALAALAFAVSASALAASECPVTEFDADEVIAKISAATSCGAAAEIAESCARRSRMDGRFVHAATIVCEKSFRQRTPSRELATYDHLLDLCNRKYAGHRGSMYLSMAAFCRLRVVQAFASIFTPFGE